MSIELWNQYESENTEYKCKINKNNKLKLERVEKETRQCKITKI